MFRFFENIVDPFANVQTGTPPAEFWPYLKSQLVPFRRYLPLMILSAMAVAIIDNGVIFYSGRVIDLMSAHGPEGFFRTYWLELLIASLIVLFVRPAMIGLDHLFLEQSLAANLQEQARWRGHRHMLGQSTSFFQNDFAGRLSNRVMQQGPAVEDSVYMFFDGVWFAGSFVIAGMVILSQMDLRLIIPIVVWLVVYGWYTRRIALRVASASEKWSDARSLVTGRVVDAYANIESVKLFAQDGREEEYARSAMRRLRLRFQRFTRLMTELSFVLNVINSILIIGVLGMAVWLWSHGAVTVGEAAAASALTVRLNAMSGWIMWVTIELFENAGTIREGLRSIAVDHAVTDAENAKALNVDKGQITFADVSHHYGRDTGGLDKVTLQIEAGQRVGLVGRSGAGKSTMMNLLLRFHDAEQGAITVDGQDVAGVTQDSLRGQIGVVTQDNSLLHRSIRANILYGRPSATEAEMVEAAKRAEAHDFIADLVDPKGRTGYNAYVGERGVKLSGGQRQRIAIARVILKDAPILILDEATSALDSEVEAAIQNTLYGVMEGKTVIAIAHRLSTIARMDRIIVLDEGRIIEDGSHEALLKNGKIYAGLWSRQSGGFLGQEAAE